MRAVILATTLICAGSPALASGGLSCTGDDETVKFEVSAGVTRGMGGPTFNFRGEMEVLAKGVADDLRKQAFEERHLAQYWLDGKELRLLIYREREDDGPFGSVELEIRTQAGDDEGLLRGEYDLTVSDIGDGGSDGEPRKLTGAVSCFVE